MRFSLRWAQALSTGQTIETMVIPANNAIAKKRLPISTVRLWLDIPLPCANLSKSVCAQYDVAHIESYNFAGPQSIGTRWESVSIVNLLRDDALQPQQKGLVLDHPFRAAPVFDHGDASGC